MAQAERTRGFLVALLLPSCAEAAAEVSYVDIAEQTIRVNDVATEFEDLTEQLFEDVETPGFAIRGVRSPTSEITSVYGVTTYGDTVVIKGGELDPLDCSKGRWVTGTDCTVEDPVCTIEYPAKGDRTMPASITVSSPTQTVWMNYSAECDREDDQQVISLHLELDLVFVPEKELGACDTGDPQSLVGSYQVSERFFDIVVDSTGSVVEDFQDSNENWWLLDLERCSAVLTSFGSGTVGGGCGLAANGDIVMYFDSMIEMSSISDTTTCEEIGPSTNGIRKL